MGAATNQHQLLTAPLVPQQLTLLTDKEGVLTLSA